MKNFYCFTFLFIFVLVGCNNEEIVKHTSIPNRYDPSKPLEITDFTPQKGEINDRIIIEGNFGSDVSKFKVLFAEDKEATIISSDGTSIYCLVPKQPDGENSIKVVVDNKEITIDKKFKYTQSQKVSTICGSYRKEEYKDGTLSEALFCRTAAINVVADDNIVVIETHNKRIRLVSQADNQVTTIFEGIHIGKPAVNKTRDTMYVVELVRNSGKIYRMSRQNNWGPELIRSNIDDLKDGEQWACALDNSGNYLYIRNHVGVFVRVNLKEKGEDGRLIVEKLIDHNTWTNGGTYNWLVYSSVEDCFYASQEFTHTILKLYQGSDGAWIEELFAGVNNRPGNTDGDRLNDASFFNPNGMAVDSEGNLYITERGNYDIRKISYPSGYVSTIAGTGKQSGDIQIDGLPLKSTFKNPVDIAVDSDDNFYIAEDDGCNVRKLAIE